MEIELLETDGVPLQSSVHIPLDLPAKRLVDQIRQDENDYDDEGEDSAYPHKQSPLHIDFVARKTVNSRPFTELVEAALKETPVLVLERGNRPRRARELN